MPIPEADQRNALRKAKDEQIAAEPPLAAPQLPSDAAFAPLETHLAGRVRRPSPLPAWSKTAWCVFSTPQSNSRNIRVSLSWHRRVVTRIATHGKDIEAFSKCTDGSF